MKNYEVIKSEVMFSGKLMNVLKDVIRFDNGREAFREKVAKKHTAAAICALDEKGRMIFVEQHRYGTDMDMLEVPAGLVDPGEDSKTAAVRELEEECGLKAAKCEYICDFYCSPGFLDEKISMYLCEGMTETQQDLDEDEYIEIYRYTVDEALEMVKEGKITDGKTLMLICWAKNYLNEKSK